MSDPRPAKTSNATATPRRGYSLEDPVEWERAVGALRDGDERYRELFENANEVIYTHDLAGYFTSLNAAAVRLTGYTHEEALGLRLTDLVTPESRDVVRAMLDRRLSGEREALRELTIRAKDGRVLSLEVSTRLILEDGEPVGVHGIARDVTERKRAERSLRENEERFRMLVENSSDGIELLSADGTIIFASASCTRILGYSLEEYIGHNVFDFVHADDRDRAAWSFADCLSKPGVAIAAELRYRHKDGSWRAIEGVGVNRIDVPGVGAIVVNFRDVTERRRAEQALAESEERFRAVFESALIAIVQVDLNGTIVAANRATQTMSGFTFEELRGRTLADFIHPDDYEVAHRDLTALIAGTRESYQAERRYIVKDNQPRWARVSASVVRDHAGQVRFCIAMLDDITARKHAEAELVETNQRLSVWVEELELRSREISLLSELGEMLQACKSAGEAYDVVGPIASELFPRASGCLSVVAEPGALVDAVSTWGGWPGPAAFSADDCWAVRRGRLHVVEDLRHGVVCRHLNGVDLRASLCTPLVAHGELLGVFTIGLPEGEKVTDARRRLAVTVAEHVALALANLKLHETLRSQSIRDPLTGLFNRRYMEESLEREMRRAARSHHPVGIIMLDIDHFKGYNDRCGHDAGDALLKAVGTLLQRSVRAEDIACRYGGEEFTLILPEASMAEAAQRADYIREAVKHLTVAHHRLLDARVTLSAGVAFYPEHGPTGDVVLRAADAALYHAKARGRDRVTINRATGLFADGIEDYRS